MQSLPLKDKDSDVFGEFDTLRIQQYFESNHSIYQNVRTSIEDKKDLLVFTSGADPYYVFLKTASTDAFDISEIIIIMALVMVYGRSLKSLRRQVTNEAGGTFKRHCIKYRVKYDYNRDNLEGTAKSFTTKVEHLFAAFPFVAQQTQLELVRRDLLNFITPFTTRGTDFQSSTALSLFINAEDALAAVLLHEVKNQLYIKLRTTTQTQDDMIRTVTYKGVDMANAIARTKQAIDSRQFIILGMLSVDLLVKMLWAAEVNCPPFKNSKGFLHFDTCLKKKLLVIPNVMNAVENEKESDMVTRVKSTVSATGIQIDHQAAMAGVKNQEDYVHALGIKKDILNEKINIFKTICRSVKIPDDRIMDVIAAIGIKSPGFDGIETRSAKDCFTMLKDHYSREKNPNYKPGTPVPQNLQTTSMQSPEIK